jgi:predicted RecB family endonuclease
MQQEREREAAARRAGAEAEAAKRNAFRAAQDQVRTALAASLTEPIPQRRGIRFEDAVNELFKIYDISIRESFRESFRVVEDKGQGVIEQIDGVIELDGELYFVEVKCLTSDVGVDDVSRHLVRVYHRHSGRGLFISATPFSAPALKTCVEALQHKVVTLCLLEEIFEVLDQHGDLRKFLKTKVQAAVIDKKPFVRLRVRGGRETA